MSAKCIKAQYTFTNIHIYYYNGTSFYVKFYFYDYYCCHRSQLLALLLFYAVAR